MIFVIDACALIALLARESGAETIESLISDRSNLCAIHSLNLCEVYYDLIRRAGRERADAVIEAVSKSGIAVREDMDKDFWMFAGRIKAENARVSMADCVCAALASRLEAEIHTSDHEIDALANKGVCKVRYIR